jgi:hypothetical protein
LRVTVDTGQAHVRALISELKEKYPKHTLLNFYWLPSVEAVIELNKNNPSRAVADMEDTARYELSGVGNLNPAYILGQA